MAAKDTSLKCQWVAKLKESDNLRLLAQCALPTIGQDFWVCNFKPCDVVNMVKDGFWADVARAWAKVYYFIPNNVTQIAAQSLWFNSGIKIQKRCVYIESAYKAGIKFVYNIWNQQEGSFLSFDQLTRVYGNTAMSYLQYYGLISAIPSNWVIALRGTRFILESFRFPVETFQGKMTSTVYDKIVSDKTLLMKLYHKWEVKLGTTLDYETFLTNFQQIYTLTKSSRLRNFQFRFLHRIVFATNYCSNGA